MEGIGLFYQYVLEEAPCVLCIHFRIIHLAMILIALVALLVRKNKVGRIFTALALFATSVVMAERTYQLLGTERRFVVAECSFKLDFPEWIAVDKWLPWLFDPKTSCGYTPELLFGITMAEAFVVVSAVMLIFTFWMVLVSIFKR